MTLIEILQKTIENGYVGVDNTCNGKCIKCGECCGTVLPVDQEDVDKMVEHIILHNIRPQRHILVMQNKLQCPYYTGNKEKGCSIYEARPKICKYYKCDKKGVTLEECRDLIKAVPIDMWHFALDIEKEMNRNGSKNMSRICCTYGKRYIKLF